MVINDDNIKMYDTIIYSDLSIELRDEELQKRPNDDARNNFTTTYI